MIEPVHQVRVVGEVALIHAVVRRLVAELHAVRAGDVRRGAAPREGEALVARPVLRCERQVLDPVRTRAGNGIGRRLRALLLHLRDGARRVPWHFLPAVVAVVGAEAGVEEQPARQGRRPRGLLRALAGVRAPRVVRELGRLRGRCEAKRPGGTRRAADDPFVVRLLPATIVGSWPRGALTGTLLVPEDVEAIARRGLHRETQAHGGPVAGGHSLLGEVRDVGELGGVAGVLVAVHAGNRLPASFLSRVHEVPHAILQDRPADAGIEVPQLEQFTGRTQTGVSQFVGVVAADQAVTDPRGVDGAADRVASRLRNDVHGRAADLGFAQAAGCREGDLLRVRDVGQVSRDAAAAERRADAEAIDLQAAFGSAPTGTAEHDEAGLVITSREPPVTAGTSWKSAPYEREVGRAAMTSPSTVV